MLFSPASHLWVRLTRDNAEPAGLTPKRSAWHVHVGITERGMQDVGSITGLEQLAPPGTAVNVGEPLLRVSWEGHKISGATNPCTSSPLPLTPICAYASRADGDELYHTTWQNVEGETIVSAPVSGTLVSLHERAAAVAPDAEHYERMDDLDETDWLALLHVDRPALQSARLVGEDAYREHCRALGPGAFGSEGYRD